MQPYNHLIAILLMILLVAIVAWLVLIMIGFTRRTETQKGINKSDLIRTIIYICSVASLSGLLEGMISIVGSENPVYQDIVPLITGILPCILGNLFIVAFGFSILVIKLQIMYGKNDSRE